MYLPFIRISNSYNRLSAVSYDLGFYRKLCDNGVIFEQNNISLRYNHNREIIGISDFSGINKSHLDNMINDFREKIHLSADLYIPREYFVALAASVLEKKFKLDDPNQLIRMDAIFKFKEFDNTITSLSDHYAKEFRHTAYTLYNVMTDYASNTKHPAISVTGLQSRCGQWLKSLSQIAQQPHFSWYDQLGSYDKLLPKELRKEKVY